jgi:hypothetical protein
MSGPDLDLKGLEWDVRQRAAEAIIRGDTPDTRDLEWLAEGYLKLIELAGDADDRIRELENDLEDAKNEVGDPELLTWRSSGKQADQLIYVPITQEIYDELLKSSAQIAALNEQDADTSAAVAAFSALLSWANLQESMRTARDAVRALHEAPRPFGPPRPRAKRFKKE